MAGASVELRYPLLRVRTIYFSAVPIPQEFSVWRFGIGLAIFGDTGTAWFRGDRLQFASLVSGYGGGIDFLLPYSAVLRLEYARNDHAKDQFIVDIRGAF